MKIYTTPSEKEIDHAADVLECTPLERQKMHGFYRMERVQNREANIALLKGLWRLFLGTLKVLGKVALVLFLLYALMQGLLALY